VPVGRSNPAWSRAGFRDVTVGVPKGEEAAPAQVSAPAPRRPAPRRGEKPFGRRVRTGNVEGLVDRQNWKELGESLDRASAPAGALERLRAYARLLITWNREVSNLISPKDEGRFIDRHLRESIDCADWLRETTDQRWIDLGSGGGLPGIPLLLAGVGANWTLVESRRTKTLFLRRVIQDLEIPNVTVVNERLENIVTHPEHLGAFDGFTSRATVTLAPTLEMATPLIRSGGDAFLWKGSRREQEMAAETAWRASWTYDGERPVGVDQTVVCRFRRI
jgi:16S rRNA (guanine527-N7)-methyltransferase